MKENSPNSLSKGRSCAYTVICIGGIIIFSFVAPHSFICVQWRGTLVITKVAPPSTIHTVSRLGFSKSFTKLRLYTAICIEGNFVNNQPASWIVTVYVYVFVTSFLFKFISHIHTHSSDTHTASRTLELAFY